MRDPDLWFRFLLACLATWRLTHLLACEDGPANLIARLRRRLGASLPGKLMDCFNCLSVWVAAPTALWLRPTPLEWLFACLAISGAACLLQRAVQEPVVIQPLPAPGKEE